MIVSPSFDEYPEIWCDRPVIGITGDKTYVCYECGKQHESEGFKVIWFKSN
jgi:hypothetical protein